MGIHKDIIEHLRNERRNWISRAMVVSEIQRLGRLFPDQWATAPAWEIEKEIDRLINDMEIEVNPANHCEIRAVHTSQETESPGLQQLELF